MAKAAPTVKPPTAAAIATQVLIEAHKHSTKHRVEIEASATCACFFCFRKFKNSAIKAWVDSNQTALCPGCGVDAVLGSASEHRLDDPFLRKMHQQFFGYRSKI